MSVVNIEQITLSPNNITHLTNIIIQRLAKNPNTQIYISNALYEELIENSNRFCIWVESIYKGYQYGDGVEKALLFAKEKDNFDFLLQMNFVSCCKDFWQLTYFLFKGVKYTHYLCGMDNVIFIHAN